MEPIENLLIDAFTKTKNLNKIYHIAGGFNLNVPDHDKNRKVQDFLNLTFYNGLMSTINYSTRVTTTTPTAIDHIFRNSFFNKIVKNRHYQV